MWNSLLKAAGGALVPEKCFWYLIKPYKVRGSWQYKTKTQTPATIQIQDE